MGIMEDIGNAVKGFNETFAPGQNQELKNIIAAIGGAAVGGSSDLGGIEGLLAAMGGMGESDRFRTQVGLQKEKMAASRNDIARAQAADRTEREINALAKSLDSKDLAAKYPGVDTALAARAEAELIKTKSVSSETKQLLLGSVSGEKAKEQIKKLRPFRGSFANKEKLAKQSKKDITATILKGQTTVKKGTKRKYKGKTYTYISGDPDNVASWKVEK